MLTTLSHLPSKRKCKTTVFAITILITVLVSNHFCYVCRYFMEVLSGLRTELEMFEEELQHLEDLHQDLMRPSDRFSTLGEIISLLDFYSVVLLKPLQMYMELTCLCRKL